MAVFVAPALAQQDTADRLWQSTEQQVQQSRQQTDPNSLDMRQNSAYEAAVRSLTQSPRTQLEKLTFSILAAVNNGNWFGADRLLRQYEKVPHHDPSLFDFVSASRDATQGNYSVAIKGYRKVLQSNPLFTRAELDLARVQFADSRLRDAQQTFDHLENQQLPQEIERSIAEYQSALKNRTKAQVSLTLSMVREDNANNANTVVVPCSYLDEGVCRQNAPGKKASDTGFYFEGSLNKLWPLAGNNGILLRNISYGNHYWHEDAYDNLISTTYLGYQYSSARNQLQLLPSFEYDREGRHTAYHAPGFRTSLRSQLSQRLQVELSYEYKARDFTHRFKYLEGDLHSIGFFGSYVLQPDLVLYGSFLWRDNEAQNKIYTYNERIARLGFYKSFNNQITMNIAYGYRDKQAKEVYVPYGRLQRDHENSLYLNVTVPRWAWQGFTPTLTYEYRKNSSSIPQAYDYEKNRITVGFNKTF